MNGSCELVSLVGRSMRVSYDDDSQNRRRGGVCVYGDLYYWAVYETDLTFTPPNTSCSRH